jgi:hypothetical protein
MIQCAVLILVTSHWCTRYKRIKLALGYDSGMGLHRCIGHVSSSTTLVPSLPSQMLAFLRYKPR